MTTLPPPSPHVVSGLPKDSIDTASTAGEGVFLKQCAWCRKFVNERGEHITVPVWVDQKNVTHGICPACFLEQMGELNTEASDPKGSLR